MLTETLFTTVQKCVTCGWESAELVKVGNWPYCAQCLAKELLHFGVVIRNLNDALHNQDIIIQKHVMDKYKMDHALKRAGVDASTLGSR